MQGQSQFRGCYLSCLRREGEAQGQGFALFMVVGMLNSNPEKTQARNAYDTCLDSLSSSDRARNGTSSFIAGACEKMRADFIQKYGVNP